MHYVACYGNSESVYSKNNNMIWARSGRVELVGVEAPV